MNQKWCTRKKPINKPRTGKARPWRRWWIHFKWGAGSSPPCPAE